MTKNYELFIEDLKGNSYPFFSQNTGKYFQEPYEPIHPKDFYSLMLDEVYKLDEELCEALFEEELDYFVVPQLTAQDIADYILNTSNTTYYPSVHEYSISYDLRNEKLTDIESILDGDDVTVNYHVEAENLNNDDFMNVCKTLAEELNYNIRDYLNAF